jgi:hypothetical protein
MSVGRRSKLHLTRFLSNAEFDKFRYSKLFALTTFWSPQAFNA